MELTFYIVVDLSHLLSCRLQTRSEIGVHFLLLHILKISILLKLIRGRQLLHHPPLLVHISLLLRDQILKDLFFRLHPPWGWLLPLYLPTWLSEYFSAVLLRDEPHLLLSITTLHKLMVVFIHFGDVLVKLRSLLLAIDFDTFIMLDRVYVFCLLDVDLGRIKVAVISCCLLDCLMPHFCKWWVFRHESLFVPFAFCWAF